jgi:oligosaccharide repeat unit polymerase
MILLLIFSFSVIGIISGRLIFRKWINHLTTYSILWGALVFLYELKLLPYPDITPLAWFYIVSAFLAFIFGILSVISGRDLFSGKQIPIDKSSISLKIFIDDGKTIKCCIIFFSIIALYSGIQHWMVLIDKFGSIPHVFINANRIYKLTNQGEITGIVPYISTFGYVAIFFAGIYTAYKGKFSFLSFFPFIGIIINDLASIGRAGMLLALMEFLFSFFLFRHLLKNISKQRFQFSKKNATIAFSILLLLLIVTASFVRITRSSFENYQGASKELRQLRGNAIISPSLYLYLSSDVGVLSQYLSLGGENSGFGENTFLTFYGLLAKFGAVDKPVLFQKGYYIPMWTNTGTYIRELHADFGILGAILGPYILGFLITWLWFKFYEKKNLVVFTFLVYLYLIVGFSFLVMVTRLPSWTISLFIIVIIIPFLEKIAQTLHNKSLA